MATPIGFRAAWLFFFFLQFFLLLASLVTGREEPGIAVASETSFFLPNVLLESASSDPSVKCLPWAVPQEHRCRYVKEHHQICGDDKGIVDYLLIHYCYLGRWCVDIPSPVHTLPCGTPLYPITRARRC